jgi:hypothetical protein
LNQNDDEKAAPSSSCFDPVMAHFHLRLVEKMMMDVDDIVEKSVNKPDPRIDYIFYSIKCLAKLCASLTDNAYCLPGFYDKMKEFREDLNRVLARFDSNQ